MTSLHPQHNFKASSPSAVTKGSCWEADQLCAVGLWEEPAGVPPVLSLLPTTVSCQSSWLSSPFPSALPSLGCVHRQQQRKLCSCSCFASLPGNDCELPEEKAGTGTASPLLSLNRCSWAAGKHSSQLSWGGGGLLSVVAMAFKPPQPFFSYHRLAYPIFDNST